MTEAPRPHAGGRTPTDPLRRDGRSKAGAAKTNTGHALALWIDARSVVATPA